MRRKNVISILKEATVEGVQEFKRTIGGLFPIFFFISLVGAFLMLFFGDFWGLVIAVVWLGICFMAWALVRAGDLADQRTKRVEKNLED